MKSNLMGYMASLLSSLTYSVWFLVSQEIVPSGSPQGSLFVVMMIALGFSALLNIRGMKRIRFKPFLVSMGGGILFVLGNIIFYYLIPKDGIGGCKCLLIDKSTILFNINPSQVQT
ncbi:hypothetical protein [Vulcanisaeta souniana]|uniref:EamA domain-containing protein n=1 Tax=Vulcanisaeta souniana JCM 11219 TaxID=1293586 RepID=A0ABM8BN30_9CREN|nr:hypothetical protein [Vulcanisaeta souniana]BDR92409.1 hypothetical protein Vsou_15020 [Vulcanisaeta souniana JCM 11219]